ncbi:hypothetical protein [Pseudomonas monteilii]|uniref:hypothetical protein n=1 Tax=Pseudomonas monteilii TaxID=76759 RepID=UPI001E409D31|nr:hypothetical protein [Pseudomonas monteilii]MCE1009279.1 hypothetical protein [Pseudomonas monteilii]
MMTPKARLAVLKALLKSPATWKLLGLLLVTLGATQGDLIAELFGELIGELMGAVEVT